MSSPDFEAAKTAFLAGLQAQSTGDLPEAETQYRRSLALLPGRPSTLSNLGAVLVRRGQPASALPLLEQALAAEPDSPESRIQRALALAALGRDDAALQDLTTVLATQPDHVAVWLQQADCQARLGRLDEALASSEHALALDAQHSPAWARRGALLKDMGRLAEAAAALRRAIDGGADPALNGFLLASIEGRAAPPQPPPGYVQHLFDGYAQGFDQHLVQGLQYQAPQVLADLLGPHAVTPGWASALDLGCGTGLCAPLLRPWVRHLAGVDLSPRMLAQARARGLYDSLVQQDLAEHLAQTDARHDLLISADVFIYVGDLAAVFAGARRVLQPGGLFALSVEQVDDAVDFELRPSSRYGHSLRYLRELAAMQQLALLDWKQQSLRLDQRLPVKGLYLLLQAPG